MTDIYFLLPAGQFSRRHRVAHDELWNFYERTPLSLLQLSLDLLELQQYCLDPGRSRYKQMISAGCW